MIEVNEANLRKINLKKSSYKNVGQLIQFAIVTLVAHLSF